MNDEVVITFDSTHHALATQKSLTEQAIPFRVIPTPVEISSNCGIALLISKKTASACTILSNVSLTTVRFHGNKIEILGPYID